MIEKSLFINRFVKPMLKAADGDIIDVVYQNSKLNGEYVHIYSKGGSKKTVNVTADSPLMVVSDIVKPLLN